MLTQRTDGLGETEIPAERGDAGSEEETIGRFTRNTAPTS
jgi:hypothetical protein